MLSKGPAKKVTIYVNEDTQRHAGSLDDAIMTFLMNKGVTGATATRAMSGSGAHRVLRTPKIEVLAEHLPVIVEFVEEAAKVDAIPTLYEMVTDGLIEVQDTTIVKVARKDRRLLRMSRDFPSRSRSSRAPTTWIRRPRRSRKCRVMVSSSSPTLNDAAGSEPSGEVTCTLNGLLYYGS